MNQKLSDWASIAEIVSGIAVVVSLIFLIAGIRENTEITRAAAYERSIDSFNEWRMWLSSDDELRRGYETWFAGHGDDLDEDILSRVGWAVNVVWAIYEKSYFANQAGTFGTSRMDTNAGCYLRHLCAFVRRLEEPDDRATFNGRFCRVCERYLHGPMMDHGRKVEFDFGP
jgi:hypothetical protein